MDSFTFPKILTRKIWVFFRYREISSEFDPFGVIFSSHSLENSDFYFENLSRISMNLHKVYLKSNLSSLPRQQATTFLYHI